jgi:hypothetical protein
MTAITPAALAFVGLIACGLAAFFVALWRWLRGPQTQGLPGWRKVFFDLGFLAVAAQAVLLALSWTHIATSPALFARWARFVFPSFLVAAVLVLMGRGVSRWLLLASSFLLFVVCFFIMLTP